MAVPAVVIGSCKVHHHDGIPLKHSNLSNLLCPLETPASPTGAPRAPAPSKGLATVGVLPQLQAFSKAAWQCGTHTHHEHPHHCLNRSIKVTSQQRDKLLSQSGEVYIGLGNKAFGISFWFCCGFGDTRFLSWYPLKYAEVPFSYFTHTGTSPKMGSPEKGRKKYQKTCISWSLALWAGFQLQNTIEYPYCNIHTVVVSPLFPLSAPWFFVRLWKVSRNFQESWALGTARHSMNDVMEEILQVFGGLSRTS